MSKVRRIQSVRKIQKSWKVQSQGAKCSEMSKIQKVQNIEKWQGSICRRSKMYKMLRNLDIIQSLGGQFIVKAKNWKGKGPSWKRVSLYLEDSLLG